MAKKSISDISNSWKDKVNEKTGNFADSINSKITGGINSAFGGITSDMEGNDKNDKFSM